MARLRLRRQRQAELLHLTWYSTKTTKTWNLRNICSCIRKRKNRIEKKRITFFFYLLQLLLCFFVRWYCTEIAFEIRPNETDSPIWSTSRDLILDWLTLWVSASFASCKYSSAVIPFGVRCPRISNWIKHLLFSYHHCLWKRHHSAMVQYTSYRYTRPLLKRVSQWNVSECENIVESLMFYLLLSKHLCHQL